MGKFENGVATLHSYTPPPISNQFQTNPELAETILHSTPDRQSSMDGSWVRPIPNQFPSRF